MHELFSRSAACLLLGALLLGPTAAQAHQCGDDSIVLFVEEIDTYTITGDRQTTYEVVDNTNPNVASTLPQGPFDSESGEFVITGESPGTTTITIFWDATDAGGEEGACEVFVEVLPEPGNETGENAPEAGTGGDPVSTFTGELFFTESPDLSLGGPLPVRFQRYYGSFLERDGKVQSALGSNWAHNFDWRLVEVALLVGVEIVEVVSWRGRVIRFEDDGGGWTQTTQEEQPFQLVVETNGYRLANPRTQRIYTFDTGGTLTKIGDGRGNVLTLSYNSSGQLTGVSDGLGRSLTFGYNSGGRLTSVSDGTRTVQFGFTNGLLTSATNPLGNTTNYSYDGSSSFTGLLTEKTRPGGNAHFTQTYDDQGRVASQTDAFANKTTFAYSVDSNTGERTTTVTDPLGNATEHVHNFEGHLLSMTDANGQKITFGYSDAGQRDQITDRLGAVTQFGFDSASGLPTSINNAQGDVTNYNYTSRSDEGFTFRDLTGIGRPDGTSISIGYDGDGNPTSFTGPENNGWTATYNSRGQLLTVTNPEGGTTTITYNSDGTVASVEDPDNKVTTYSYDAFRRLTSIDRPDGTSRTFSYDDADRLVQVTDEEGRKTTFSYDKNNNLTQITDPSSQSVQRSFDDMDRLKSATDRNGQSLGYSYDADGRLVSITDRTGNTWSFGYDGEDRLVSITNGAEDTWQISYDAEGVPTALTNPAGETTTLTSNAMGWITQIVSPLGHTRGITRDALGRATAIQNPSGGTVQLNRDGRGLLSGMTLPGGASASYNRDGMGFLEGRTGPNNGSWNAPRDALGRITERTDPLNQTATNNYDNRNRLTSVDLPGGLGTVTRSYDGTNNLTGLSPSDGSNLSYNYGPNGYLTGATGVTLSRNAEGQITESNGLTVGRDGEGRIASVTLPGGTVTYTYDGAGRLTKVEDWQDGTTTFSYDNAGRLTKVTRPNGTTTTFTYDAGGRLTGIEETDSGGNVLASSTLTLDARGNVVQADRSGPVAPNLSPSSESYSYDAAHQIQGFNYDALGRVTDDGTHTFTWDGLSRLQSYSDGTTTTSFGYDAFGNRTSKSEGGTTQSCVWNYALGLPSVSVKKEGGTDQRYYVHTPGGRLLYSVDASGGSRHFYHFDEMGNTTLITGESGSVEAAYAYSPYGTVVAEQGSVENLFTWQGAFGVMAEGNGLYYMRARYYDASSRRFLSRDPVRSLRPDEINPYQYARNNPRGFVDPRGLQVFPDDVSEDRPSVEAELTTTSGQVRQKASTTLDVRNNDDFLQDLAVSGEPPSVSGSVSWNPEINVEVKPVIFTPGGENDDGEEIAESLDTDFEFVFDYEGKYTIDKVKGPSFQFLPEKEGTFEVEITSLDEPAGASGDTPVKELVEGSEYPVSVVREDDEAAVGTVIVEERSTDGVSLHTAPGADGSGGPLGSRETPQGKLPDVLLERPR